MKKLLFLSALACLPLAACSPEPEVEEGSLTTIELPATTEPQPAAVPVESAPVEAAPAETAPTEPAPAEPAPSNP